MYKCMWKCTVTDKFICCRNCKCKEECEGNGKCEENPEHCGSSIECVEEEE